MLRLTTRFNKLSHRKHEMGIFENPIFVDRVAAIMMFICVNISFESEKKGRNFVGFRCVSVHQWQMAFYSAAGQRSHGGSIEPDNDTTEYVSIR